MKSDLYITSRKNPLYYMFSLSIARYSFMSELVFFFSEFNLDEYMGVIVLGCSRAVRCLATLMDPKVFLGCAQVSRKGHFSDGGNLSFSGAEP